MSQKCNYFHGRIFIFISYLLFSIRKRKTRVSGVWSVWNLLTIASGYRDQSEIFKLSSEEQSVFLSCSVASNCKPGVTLGKWRYLITEKKKNRVGCVECQQQGLELSTCMRDNFSGQEWSVSYTFQTSSFSLSRYIFKKCLA